MKILFSLLLVLILPVAGVARDGFKIIGQLGGTIGGNLVLVASGTEGPVKLDEAVMVNGEFEFAGSVEGITLAYILTAEQQTIATLMLENMEYTIVAGENGIEVRGGGESQEILNRFEAINQVITREKMKMEQEAKVAYAVRNQMRVQSLQQQFQKLLDELSVRQQELMKTYKDSPVTAFVVASGMNGMEYEALKEIYGGLGEVAKSSLYGQIISEQLARLQQVEVGAVAPDFKGVTATGDTVSLHGIRSKVKLIDFWALWCGPCRQEMPNVVKIYKKYHDAGLEIVGISLDEKRDAWVKAMGEMNMKWHNISDLQGWRSGFAALYFVRGIPHTILLDENNHIVAKNLRDRALEKKIAELLGK